MNGFRTISSLTLSLLVVTLTIPTLAAAAPRTSGSQSGGGGLTIAYSKCMRAHGITKFPNPNSQGIISNLAKYGINPKESPKFKAAATACHKLASGSSAKTRKAAPAPAAAMKFVACMRSHGLPKFPIPSSQGTVILTGTGYDPSSAVFRNAQAICKPLLNGGK
jgi:hypothetical protein